MNILYYLMILLSIASCASNYRYNIRYIKGDTTVNKIEDIYQKKNKAEPEIPKVISMPLYFPVIDESDKLISVNIDSSIPVLDLLIEIGRLADINLDIDPQISGSIVLKLKDKPVDEVLQTIAKSAKIRCMRRNDIFRIEQDLPYTRNYYIDFINIQRSNESNFVVNNKIISNTNEDTTIVSGSDNRIKSKSDGDLWFSLERNLSALIDINGTHDDEFYSTNREAGIITLNARDNVHKTVKEYISKVRELTSSQVMIEAKVVEITLDDRYQYGIDWENLNYINRLKTEQSTNNKTRILTASYSDLDDVVRTLSRFGASKVISSPRLHALNNQQAIMSFTQNYVYFTADIKKKIDSDKGDFSILSKMNSVPIGIILTIHPSIDVIDKEIFMNIHPILSRVNGYVKDPSTEYAIQKGRLNVGSDIPIIEVREIDSMIKIKSGEIMVIGGLIEHRHERKSSRLKKVSKGAKTIETVIFLKATIIPPFGLLGL